MGKRRLIRCNACTNLYPVTDWDDLKLCPDCWNIYYNKAQEEGVTVFDILVLQGRRLKIIKTLD